MENPMEFIKKIFSFDFWFISHDYTWQFLVALSVVFIIGIIVAVFLRLLVIALKKKKQPAFLVKYYKRLSNFFLVIGIIGLLLVLMSMQSIFIFGLRIWYVVLFLVLLIWGYNLLVFYFKKLPEIKKRKEENDQFLKYLPKKKK